MKTVTYIHLSFILIFSFLPSSILGQEECPKPPNVFIDIETTPFVCNLKIYLDATGSTGVQPFTYQWSNGVWSDYPGTGIIFQTGAYTVTVTDNNGCTGTAAVEIDDALVGPPTAEAALDAIPIQLTCIQECATLDASASSGVPPLTYIWGGPAPISGNGPFVEACSPGTYFVTVTDQGGCTDVASVEVLESEPIELIVKHTDIDECDGLTNIFVYSPNLDHYNTSYEWNTGSIDFVIYNSLSGTYTVTVTDNITGCTAVGSITVEITDIFEADLTVKDICLDGYSHSLGGFYTDVYGGTPPYSYEWSNGDTGHSIEFVEEGEYWVTITDNKGCTYELYGIHESVCCTETPILIAEYKNVKGCVGSSITFGPSAIFSPDDVLTWYFNNDPYNETSPSITLDPLSSDNEGKYTLVVTNDEDCTTIHYVYVVYPTCCGIPVSATFNYVCNGNSLTLGPPNTFPSGTVISWTFNNQLIPNANTIPFTFTNVSNGVYGYNATFDDCLIGAAAYHVNVLQCFQREYEGSFTANPNPTKGLLSFDFIPDENIDFTIYDIQGKIIQTGSFEAGGTPIIDISQQAKGIYILSFSYQNRMYQEKLIKQ